ncbi:unnamed protein product, partial [Tenebrio molitor]
MPCTGRGVLLNCRSVNGVIDHGRTRAINGYATFGVLLESWYAEAAAATNLEIFLLLFCVTSVGGLTDTNCFDFFVVPTNRNIILLPNNLYVLFYQLKTFRYLLYYFLRKQ